MIGNNSAGSSSIRYGMTIDHVERARRRALRRRRRARLEAVPTRSARGARAADTLAARDPPRAARHRRAPPRRAARLPALLAPGGRLPARPASSPRTASFDLAKVVVGSEGTLAVGRRGRGRARAGRRGPRHGGRATSHRRPRRSPPPGTRWRRTPTAVELLDRFILDLSRRKLEYRALGDILEGDPDALLFVEFEGDDEDEVDRRGSTRSRRRGASTATATTRCARSSPAEQAAVLKVRKAGLGLLMAASRGRAGRWRSSRTPPSRPSSLTEYVAEFKAILDRHGLDGRLLRPLLGRLPAHPPVRRPARARRDRT